MAGMNQKITELSNSNSLNSSDLMMVSRQVNETIYSSFQTQVSCLTDSFCDKFEDMNPVEVHGNWSFKSGGLFVDDRNILPNSTTVINKKYALEMFTQKLNELSAEIYGRLHIPSCVGEFIFSTSLNSLEKVQKMYGTNTKWVQIPGRFIMGGAHMIDGGSTSDGSEYGKKSEIGKNYGACNVELNIRNVPQHSHSVNFDDTPKTIRVNETVEFGKSSVVVMGSRKATPLIGEGGPDGVGDGTKAFCVLSDRRILADFEVEHDGYNKEEEPDTDAAKHTCEAEVSSRGTIQANSGGNAPHNNIPPFYSVYIWRRIA